MKSLILFLLAAPLFVVAQTSAQEFKIKGDLKSFKPINKIYLVYRNGDNGVRDSFETKDGSFKFEGKVAEPLVAMLQVKYLQQAGEEKAKMETMQLFLEPAKIDITAKDSIKNNTVTGSRGQADLDKLMKAQEVYTARLTQLGKDHSTARQAGNKEEMKKLEKEAEAIGKELKEKVFGDFLKKNPNSPVALYALQQYAGWDIDPDKVEPLFVKLPASQQQRPSAVALKERIDISKKTAIGRYAIDFVQNDTLGNPVALSSFKGRYVLVDFWASWCGPCRQENPNVVKTYEAYKDKNFTVLGVSLDRSRDPWLKAIRDDQLSWTHVSDLKFWSNAAAMKYRIQ